MAIELALDVVGGRLASVAVVADAHVLISITKGSGTAVAAGGDLVEGVATASVINYTGLL